MIFRFSTWSHTAKFKLERLFNMLSSIVLMKQDKPLSEAQTSRRLNVSGFSIHVNFFRHSKDYKQPFSNTADKFLNQKQNANKFWFQVWIHHYNVQYNFPSISNFVTTHKVYYMIKMHRKLLLSCYKLCHGVRGFASIHQSPFNS